MKNLLLLVLFIGGLTFSSKAQLKFYYYPSSNVYFDVAQKQYVYQNNGSWTPVKVLPAQIRATNGPRYVLYNRTPDVWNQNETHVKKFKTPKTKHYPKGKAIGYRGSNPNKAQEHGKGKGKNDKH